MLNHINELSACTLCPNMIGPPIHGCINKTDIVSIGQAPGIHEKEKMMPFSYTAGKTLFQWFERIGVTEEEFRKKVNMAAMCRCFPGKMKKPKSGDRKPNHQELNTCRPYLDFEIEYHKPKLIIAIGKMALEELLRLKSSKLRDYMGKIKK